MHTPRNRAAWATLVAAGVLLTAPAAGAAFPATVPAPGRGTAAVQVPAARTPMPGVWWYDAMALDEVHQQATGKGVKVAVIDGYLDPKIPDLRGAKISKGNSCRGNPSPYLTGDDASHGTAMTTAIVGQGADGKGIVGVAPDAQLRFYSFDENPDNTLVECDAILIRNQIEKAVAWGADVISMSIGTGGGLEETIEKAWESGVVVVAASGATDPNDARAASAMVFPAQMPGVVSVAAAGADAKVWKYNPYSADYLDAYLTVAAPGVEVPIGGFPEGSREWIEGGTRTGTSPATAITAGAFAVLKSRWPDATGNQLIQAVIHSARGVDAEGALTYDKVQGYGTLRLKGAMGQDPTGWPDENPLLLAPPQAMEKYPASSYDPDRAAGAQPGEAATSPSSPGEPADEQPRPAAATDSSPSPLPLFAGAGALVALLAAAGLVLARRRKTSAITEAGRS